MKRACTMVAWLSLLAGVALSAATAPHSCEFIELSAINRSERV